jgi:hypothetical protein
VRKSPRLDAPAGHSLKSINPDRLCRIERRLEVTLIENPPRLISLVRPQTRITVRLQFHQDGHGIAIGLSETTLQTTHLALRAEQALDMMPNLVCDHVRKGEITIRTEAPELLEKAEVQVHFVISRTVERTGGSRIHSACRFDGVRKEYKIGFSVAAAILRENRGPRILRICKNDGYKLSEFVRCLRCDRPSGLDHRSTGSTQYLEQFPGILTHKQNSK